MRSEASFQQILERKLQAQSTSEHQKAHAQTAFDHSHHFQDPAHLAYLMGTLGPAYFRPPARHAYPSRPKPPSPPHTLNEAQGAAAAFFANYGMPLTPAFSQRELKKAFRLLALRLHPDTNKGTLAGAFIELKKNYETLMGVFN